MSLSKIKVNNQQVIAVDEEPTFESKNLVESGGVNNSIDKKYFEILSLKYKETNNILQVNSTIPSTYIDNFLMLQSVGAQVFKVDTYYIEQYKVYKIKYIGHLASVYPVVCFSKILYDNNGNKLDKLLLKDNNISINKKLEIVFRSYEDGYLYTAHNGDYTSYEIVECENDNDLILDSNIIPNKHGAINESLLLLTSSLTTAAVGIIYEFTPHCSNTPLECLALIAKSSMYISHPVLLTKTKQKNAKFKVITYTLQDGIYSKKNSVELLTKEVGVYCTYNIPFEIEPEDYIFLHFEEISIYYVRKNYDVAAEHLPTNTFYSVYNKEFETIPEQFSSSDLINYSNSYRFSFTFCESSVVLSALDEIKVCNQTIQDTQEEIQEIINQIEGTSKSFKRIGVIRNSDLLDLTIFNSFDTSGFTFNQGAVPPQSGGINSLIQYIQSSDLDSDCLTYVLKATSAFDIMIVRYGYQYPDTSGLCARFDMINLKLLLYNPTLKGVLPTEVLKEFDITKSFIAGEYTITAVHYAEIYKFSIFGGGEIQDFYYDNRTQSKSIGRSHDNYGLVHFSGTYVLTKIEFSSQLPAEPDLLIVGDSITEADTIRALLGGGFLNRWAGLVSNKTLTSIWAEGGNRSSHINIDLATLTSLFKPKKVIYAICTNDGNFVTWRDNAIAFTLAFETLGAEVIYTMSVLRPAHQQAFEQMNAWIRQSGHRYIDFLASMTVDGLGVTRKDLFLSDGLHPTPAGHYQMYLTVINSIPDLCSN